MGDVLTTHFVDASDVDFDYNFYTRTIELRAFDEKTRQLYSLTFAQCTNVRVTYSEDDDEFRDLSNLTDGVTELESTEEGTRRFQIQFVDESIVEVWCRRFLMSPLEQPDQPGFVSPRA